ncbi:helix-turn-helix domain-containing protein [Sporolactobacillus terrae]|uniref:helix-turn-helix domain-containing protein n=1 Tax=Sporolactobacillus terrae TaxID=269673 RepID=UPI000685F5F0|nr:helix-turn-helix transcriptional regulator [Sporolactobacillus terrae]
MATFSERLKELREAAQLKQEDVAKKLRISTSAYGYYEQGRNEPSIEALLALSVLFDTSTDYLIGQTDKKIASSAYNYTDNPPEKDQALIEELKKYPELFSELTANPEKNIAALDRYWRFIHRELKTFRG